MSGAIARASIDDSAIVRAIGAVENELEAKAMLAKLSVLKDALEAADMFRGESVRYARLEAYALVRVVEICGDARSVKGKWRRLAAEWLAGMAEDERERYVNMCDDGQTIDNIYRLEVAIPEQRNALSDALLECKRDARSELKDKGMVSVPKIVRGYGNKFPRSMLAELTDGVRASVRDAGGVGIGDGNGTYILPDKRSRHVTDAVATRISAVVRDIESIADLASRCESKPTFTIKGDGEQLSFADITCLILSGVGCVSVEFDTAAARKASKALLRQVVGDIR